MVPRADYRPASWRDPDTPPNALPARSRHRAYSFLLHNGIDSLYKGYAASLDLLVLAAWNSVAKLKTGEGEATCTWTVRPFGSTSLALSAVHLPGCNCATRSRKDRRLTHGACPCSPARIPHQPASGTLLSAARAALLVLLVVEALFLQLLCTGYQWVLVQRVEAARLVGIMAMLGLPGPVLRQLASKEVKVGWEGARACWSGGRQLTGCYGAGGAGGKGIVVACRHGTGLHRQRGTLASRYGCQDAVGCAGVLNLTDCARAATPGLHPLKIVEDSDDEDDAGSLKDEEQLQQEQLAGEQRAPAPEPPCVSLGGATELEGAQAGVAAKPGSPPVPVEAVASGADAAGMLLQSGGSGKVGASVSDESLCPVVRYADKALLLDR